MMKPYRVAIYDIEARTETDVTVRHRCDVSSHRSMAAARRAAKEHADGDLFNAARYLVRITGEGEDEWWHREVAESTRGGQFSARARAFRFSGVVREAGAL